MQIEFRFCLIECFGVAFSCKALFTSKYHTESFYLEAMRYLTFYQPNLVEKLKETVAKVTDFRNFRIF